MVPIWIPESQYFKVSLQKSVPIWIPESQYFEVSLRKSAPIWIPESQSFDFETLIAYLCMQKFIRTHRTNGTPQKDPQDASELTKCLRRNDPRLRYGIGTILIFGLRFGSVMIGNGLSVLILTWI
ncbi:hypothetical protein RhiirA1_475273 [Rhizophagus irregularis]|uniref:Uncharacterized protein n=1 Tax=Rhizophagus irregularis TaxID=588596 RepID=A0A2N0QX51_9GLOM|nr:hypothetical protein RhiirA1_475273 [Rhizophagus irregularis]